MAERREILPHRGDFWHYTPARQWNLHTVSRSEISSAQYLNVGYQTIRYPTECQLTYSDAPWTCRVSLWLTNATDSSTRETQFGDIITEKSDVTERIRRAQKATLSPSASPDNFLSRAESDFEESDISFSSDCIVLHISGPDHY
jgi:hypothetical protein